MKENGPMAGKMINRNWVLKRKRRKLPCGPDISNIKEDGSVVSEALRNLGSEKHGLKSEKSPDLVSSKRKGNDGVSLIL